MRWKDKRLIGIQITNLKSVKPNVTVLNFGDDYEQRQAQGLNRIKEEWSLTFTRSYNEINAIDDFLTGAIDQALNRSIGLIQEASRLWLYVTVIRSSDIRVLVS